MVSEGRPQSIVEGQVGLVTDLSAEGVAIGPPGLAISPEILGVGAVGRFHPCGSCWPAGRRTWRPVQRGVLANAPVGAGRQGGSVLELKAVAGSPRWRRWGSAATFLTRQSITLSEVSVCVALEIVDGRVVVPAAHGPLKPDTRRVVLADESVPLMPVS